MEQLEPQAHKQEAPALAQSLLPKLQANVQVKENGRLDETKEDFGVTSKIGLRPFKYQARCHFVRSFIPFHKPLSDLRLVSHRVAHLHKSVKAHQVPN